MLENSEMREYQNEWNHFKFAPNLIVQTNLIGLATPLEFHSHQQFEVYVLKGGKTHYLINDQIFELHPGSIILLDGTELHKAQVTDGEENYVRSLIHFNPAWIEEILISCEASFILEYFKTFHHRIFTFNDLSDFNRMIHLIEELKNITEKRPSSINTAEAKITLLYLLNHVYQSEKTDVMKDTFANKTSKAEIAEEIASYIQQNFKEKLRIRKIALDLNLSESYISHLFKEVTGYTVMEYLMNYRLIQAKAYLDLAPLESTIRECALICGFESDAHFNRFFKVKTGMTPNQYKKMVLKNRK